MKGKFFLLFLLLIGSVTSSFAQVWSELGAGVTALNAGNNSINALATDASGNVYAAGWFTNAGGKYYVAKWDGTTWSELGTGANALNANDAITALAVDVSGNIYATGYFTSGGKYYVAKWNGTTWSSLGTGNTALNINDIIKKLAVDVSGNVYAAGFFTNTGNKNYVAKWDGTQWSELGTGANALNANDNLYGLVIDASNNVYVSGLFTNTGSKNYVAKWDGTQWSELGAGANALNANGAISSLAIDASNNIYAAGGFTNTPGNNYYVAKWNGTTWTEVGAGANALNANNRIFGLCVDASNNIYAGGSFTNTGGGNYVAQWDGTKWSDIGAPGNASINNLATSTAGKIYAAGQFTNAASNYYVAGYTIQVQIDSVNVNTIGNIPATIATNNGTLPLEARVYPTTVSQAVTWSVAPAGIATIGTTGITTAQANGTVWAIATSVADTTKKDSLLVTISNQVVAIDSVDVRTVGNAIATIATYNGTLPLQAVVYPAAASQAVNWSITPVTGSATISATGVVTALTDGTVWARAVSVQDPTKQDSLLITITNQHLGINEVVNSMGFKLYPNPTKDYVTVEASLQRKSAVVSVYDIVGANLLRSEMHNGTLKLDISGLSPGVYLIQYNDGSNNITTRFVKQ